MPALKKSAAKYRNRLFHNEGGGRFRDVTERACVGGTGYDTGVAVADYDGGGFKGPVVGAVHRYTLYHNNGDGTFTDVTVRSGFTASDKQFGPLWAVGGAWLDYDSDGDLDLFIVNYLRWDPSTDPDCSDYCHPGFTRGCRTCSTEMMETAILLTCPVRPEFVTTSGKACRPRWQILIAMAGRTSSSRMTSSIIPLPQPGKGYIPRNRHRGWRRPAVLRPGGLRHGVGFSRCRR